MFIGRVIGTVVATRKDEALVGYKLLVVAPQDAAGTDREGALVAVDTVGSGVGERVLVVTGSSARVVAEKARFPVDAAIVGIIDTIELA
jgi:ethanolamine utilization protein EutN